MTAASFGSWIKRAEANARAWMTARGTRIAPTPHRSASQPPSSRTAMMPIGFQNRRAPRARPTWPGPARATASAPDWLSAIARQIPFSANRTTTTASQTPSGTRGIASVARASTPSEISKNGLCRPIRSDQIPTRNCAGPQRRQRRDDRDLAGR